MMNPRHQPTRSIGDSARLVGVLMIAAVCAFSANAGPNCPTRYTVEVIPAPMPNYGVYPQDLNSTTVVGNWYPSAGGDARAFSWSPETGFVNLPFPPGTIGSRAAAITEAGEIAGTYGSAVASFGYIRAGNTLISFPEFPGSNGMTVLGMNSHRQVVGHYTQGDLHAFMWDNGTFQDISQDLPLGGSSALGINENGLITGRMGGSGSIGGHGYIWRPGSVLDLGIVPGSNGSDGIAINDTGWVCGVTWYFLDGSPYWRRRGFFYNGSNLQDIGELPRAVNIIPRDISNSGIIVGACHFPDFVHGFVYDGVVMRDLNDLVPSGTQVRLGDAFAISNDGHIAGVGTQPPGFAIGYRLTPMELRAGDVDCDGRVNIDDLFGVINHWGACGIGICEADLNGDRAVNSDDLMLVIRNWG